MTEFATSLVITALLFVVHVLWWRLRRPQAANRAVLILFALGPFAFLPLLIIGTFVIPGLAQWLPANAGAWLYALVLSLSFGAAYVMTYPAVEVESPTLIMIEEISTAGAGGLSATDFENRLGAERLIDPRLRDLINEGLIEQTSGRYYLTARGRMLARTFAQWQTLLRAGQGG